MKNINKRNFTILPFFIVIIIISIIIMNILSFVNIYYNHDINNLTMYDYISIDRFYSVGSFILVFGIIAEIIYMREKKITPVILLILVVPMLWGGVFFFYKDPYIVNVRKKENMEIIITKKYPFPKTSTCEKMNSSSVTKIQLHKYDSIIGDEQTVSAGTCYLKTMKNNYILVYSGDESKAVKFSDDLRKMIDVPLEIIEND